MSWVTRNLKNLLTTAMVGLIMLIGLPTFFYVTTQYTKQLVDDRGEILYSLANTAATVIAENLRERKREVELLAETPLYTRAPLDSPDFQQSLDRLQASYPYYSWIGLVDLEGVVKVATGGLLVGQSVAQQPWFRQSSAGTYIGDVHNAKLLAKLLPARPDGLPIRLLDFSTQIKDAVGNPRAVLGIHAYWEWSSELIRVVTPKGAQDEAIEFFIVNQDNTIIFPSTKGSSTQELKAPQISGEAMAELHPWGPDRHTRYLTAAAPVRIDMPGVMLNWKVLVRQPESKVFSLVHELQQAISIVISSAVALFIVMAWFLSRWIGRPIHQLTIAAKRVSEGRAAEFHLELPTQEMRDLSAALQQMSSDLLNHQYELEAKVVQRTAELEKLNTALSELARRDVLTALPNRLAANEFLEHEFNLLMRRPVPYAVLMMDIDLFKNINDTFGHAVGDEVLRHIGSLLATTLRDSDFVGRMGGEEFIAVLPMTPLNDAVMVGEKIRSAIETSPIAPVGAITMSIGVAIASASDDSPGDALKRADQLLYQAKRHGRNRLEFTMDAAAAADPA